MPTDPDPPSLSGNLLGRETSPYLLQHRDNPVHWLPWGAEALARAASTDKPILLSIGYAACHWCHVMAAESFQDPETAAVINRLYIPVKVDREERPDLDQIYQAALALTGQPGGWPLTMFLTPAGEPFWGGTYFPPTRSYGRPGFRELLLTVATTYQRDRATVTGNADSIRTALAHLNRSAPPAELLDLEMVDRIAQRLVREIDPFHGGIGDAPKFPQVPLFELFWRAWLRRRLPAYQTAVTQTLSAMAQGGIYDHLGGGFARYATDAAWLVPHFEKMLYDNALLIDLYTLVWQDTRSPLYAARVEETVDWVLREMVVGQADGGGGFASSLDADSEHEEGKYYVWTETEIDDALGPEASSFKAAYDVQPGGNWDGVTILNRSRAPALADAATEARLREARRLLLAQRGRRVRPGWDDKVLTDWNGLMISALANAGLVFDRPDWIAAAHRAFDFVCRALGDGDRLRHSWRHGRVGPVGTLDDTASMARAALALYEATGRPDFLAIARHWAEAAEPVFGDPAGGYFVTAADAEPLIVRPRSVQDTAVPSGAGLMLHVLARLFHLTGEARYRDRAERLVAAVSGEVERNFFPLATLLNGLDLLHRPVQIVLLGDPGDPATQALRRTVLDRSLPNRCLTQVPEAAELPPTHPAAGKRPVDGKPTAYVCRAMTCSAPVTEPAALAELLETC